MNHPELHQKAFMLLLVAVSLAFAAILLPFYSAVLWSGILALLFSPLYNRLLLVFRMRKNLAAFITLMICLVLVILPVVLLTNSLLQEGSALYQRIETGELNLGSMFRKAMAWLPSWVVSTLHRFGITDIVTVQKKISASGGQASQFLATQAVNIGQNTLSLVIGFGIMLYLLFFLLRDGTVFTAKIGEAIPLSPENKRNLRDRFTATIRATIKGNLIVAAVQGFLEGAILAVLGVEEAILLGAVMVVLSLLPAVGTALVWLPIGIYFLLTGDPWKGGILIAASSLVVAVTDSILRPILVGKDTRMPDYLVFVSTLGGLSVFGLNGFVIGPVIAALFIAAWDMFAYMETLKK